MMGKRILFIGHRAGRSGEYLGDVLREAIIGV
jgi:hypothetical protein